MPQPHPNQSPNNAPEEGTGNSAMFLKDACDLALRHGFTQVYARADERLWEKNGVRLRISPVSEGRFTCEIVAPKNMDILPFLFTDRDRPSLVRCFEAQIIKRETIISVDDCTRILHTASNVSELTKPGFPVQNLMASLLPIPETAADPCLMDGESFSSLGEAILCHRATMVRTTPGFLAIALRTMGAGQCFEIHPACLLSSHGDVRRIQGELEALSATFGLIICVQADLLRPDERLWSAYTAFFARLNRMPLHAGCRFILQTEQACGANEPLPFLELQDRERMRLRKILRKRHLTVDGSAIAAANGFLRAGLNEEEMVKRIQKTQRLPYDDFENERSVDGNDYELADVTSPAGLSPVQQLQHFQSIALAVFKERVIGHEEIVSELVSRLSLWFLLETERPLALAFCGPSGCGKNHILSAISEVLRLFFRNRRSHYVSYNAGMARDDKMWDLVRVGAGHVGAHRPGLLETLRNGSVFSADEADKNLGAKSDIQWFLLEWLDNGSFRNGLGEMIQTPRCVIALTMNAGDEIGADRRSAIGFLNAETKAEEGRERYREFFQKHTTPALQGRLDAVFFPGFLSRGDLELVCMRELSRMRREIENLCLHTWKEDDKAIATRIASEADPILGARGIIKAAQRFRASFLKQLSIKSQKP